MTDSSLSCFFHFVMLFRFLHIKINHLHHFRMELYGNVLFHNERQKSTGITDGIGIINRGERSGAEIGGTLRRVKLHGTIQAIHTDMAENQSGNLI